MNTSSPKYDRIGKTYNLTRQADPYLLSRMYALLNPGRQNQFLDIGCGSGNYTIALSQMGMKFIGVDPSSEMLNLARSKQNSVSWKLGNAEDIPVDSNSMDGVLASLTLHHWTDLTSGFKEIHRVLKQEGKFIIFTSTSEQTGAYWLQHYFPNMLLDSKNQMPSRQQIISALDVNNFDLETEEAYFVQPDLKDKFLYCGKENPSVYLDPAIRSGISSFSDLALQVEVNEGLARLQKDIETKAIREIMSRYDDRLGDYVFIAAKKS